MNNSAEIDSYQRIVNKTIRQKIPFMAHWELTYKCNLRCVHCYIVKEPRKEELCFKEIKSILDELAEQGCLYLCFSGGEIFTRRDFFDIASYAREKGFALRLQTNGTLITPKVADRIKEISVLSVGMSLYGRDATIHEAVTGSVGSYLKTVTAFRLLKERGIKTVLKSPLMRETVREFDALKRLAKELGADFVYDLTIAPKNDGSKRPLEHRLSETDLREFLASQVRPLKKESLRIGDDALLCNAGMNFISISAYGEVYPCVAIRKKCGDLRRESFDSIWLSPVLSRIRGIRFSDLAHCKGCKLLAYCDRCPGIADLEDRDILGPSTAACQVAGVLESVVERL